MAEFKLKLRLILKQVKSCQLIQHPQKKPTSSAWLGDRPMMELTQHELEFIVAVLPLRDELRSHLEHLLKQKDRKISVDLADELRDLCTERLDTHGFDANYAPTAEGEKLEALIDKLWK